MGSFKFEGSNEFFFYPKHNEYDPSPYIDFENRVVSRYGYDIKGKLTNDFILDNHLYLFFDSFNLFGDTKPQISYNYKANPIVMEFTLGLGYNFDDHFYTSISGGQNINLGNYQNSAKNQWAALGFGYHF